MYRPGLDVDYYQKGFGQRRVVCWTISDLDDSFEDTPRGLVNNPPSVYS